MDDTTNFTTVDWRAVGSIGGLLFGVTAAVFRSLSRSLDRRIQDNFAALSVKLGVGFVSKATYDLDNLKTVFSAEKVETRLALAEANIEALEISVREKRQGGS